jgi:ATP-dependent RNA helicase DDX21
MQSLHSQIQGKILLSLNFFFVSLSIPFTLHSQKKEKVEMNMEKKEGNSEENPNALSKFQISEQLRAKLKEKGIQTLFPIQALTFDTILNGSDLISRAHTS